MKDTTDKPGPSEEIAKRLQKHPDDADDKLVNSLLQEYPLYFFFLSFSSLSSSLLYLSFFTIPFPFLYFFVFVIFFLSFGLLFSSF